jgi:hypothetical protein
MRKLRLKPVRCSWDVLVCKDWRIQPCRRAAAWLQPALPHALCIVWCSCSMIVIALYIWLHIYSIIPAWKPCKQRGNLEFIDTEYRLRFRRRRLNSDPR